MIYFDLSGVTWKPIPWNADIAENPPDSASAVRVSDGVRFYCSGSKDYAGQLWNTSVPLLPIPNPFTAQLAVPIMPDDAIASNAQAIELDIMAADAAGNVGNGSGELEIPSGGIWQAWVNGKWTNVPNYPAAVPPPNQWTGLSVGHLFTPKAAPLFGTSQFQAVTLGDSSATGGLPSQPYANLGWTSSGLDVPPGTPFLTIQVQLTLRKGGGCASFKLGKPFLTVTYQ